MRAVQITRLNGPAGVDIVDIPEPTPGAEDVLIRVHAAGLTFPDLLQTYGRYQVRPALPYTPGLELAGSVVAAPAASGFEPGDKVCAVPGTGAFADLVAVHARQVLPLPSTITYDEGAGLPTNTLTAHFALVRRGRLQTGHTVIVHGAAGGLGAASIMVAKAYGANVIAVVSSPEKARAALRAGADETVGVEAFWQQIREITGGRGVDLVMDPVGGNRFTDSLRCLAPEGTLLVVGFAAGDIPSVKVNRLLLNNISVVGVGWGAYEAEHPGLGQEQWHELLPHIERGVLTPPSSRTYPVERVRDALIAMEGRRSVGKAILSFR